MTLRASFNTALVALALVLTAMSGWAQGLPAEIDCGAQTVLEPAAMPILVVTDSGFATNPFGCYLTEILRSEGLGEFQHAELSVLLADAGPLAYLSQFDVVLLAETSLRPSEEQLFRDYVSGGGNLIAMRPDPDLDDLFGLSFVAARTEQLVQYFAVDTVSGPGVGIVDLSLQYHGEADDYALAGGTAIADLYNDISTPSANPAAVVSTSGGGQAAAFTFDLARSIVLTRQGNPDWKDTEGDGLGSYRPMDMFWRSSSVSYLSVPRLPVPQADEAQRFLANLVLSMIPAPMPRMWYLPGTHKRLVVNTGDSEGGSGSSLAPPMDAAEARGGFFTHYFREPGISNTTVAMEADWRARGHETGVHMYGGGPQDFTTLFNAYQTITGSLQSKFGHGSRTARQHTIDWVGWSEMADIMAQFGTGLDTNYYHYPNYLSGLDNGYFTSSGLPQRFSDETGVLLGIYQAATQWPDEWFADKGLSVAQAFAEVTGMLSAAETSGYYSAFVNNIHPVRYNGGDITSGWADQLWDYCQANNIPSWSAEMLLDFTEARNNASFDNLTWNGTALSFDFSTPTGGQDLTLMVPTQAAGGQLLGIQLDGGPVGFTTEIIKGREYAFVTTTAASAQVVATYGLDTVAPVISSVQTSAGDTTATVTWNTDELATSRVDYGTSPGILSFSQTLAGFRTSHSVGLGDLSPSTTYFYRVTSEDQASNPSTSAELGFTTSLPQWIETTQADFVDGTLGDIEVIPQGDGAFRLGPAPGSVLFTDDFDGASLDLGSWETFNFFGGPIDVTVAGSAVTVTADTRIRTIQAFSQVTLEGLVTLGPGGNAHFGLATAVDGSEGVTPIDWIIFTAKSGQIQARTRAGGVQIDDVLPGLVPGTQYLFKIVWNPDDSVDFYVDDVLVATHTRAWTTSMHVYLTALGTQTASAENVSVTTGSAFATSGTNESSVFDAGATASFDILAATATVPAATTLLFETRTSPDAASWSPWQAVGGGGQITSPDDRYLQYRATLTTSDLAVSPVVEEVAVTYDPTPCTPSAEVCDGVDNDCDSLVDEGLGQTTCGVGECQATVDNCVGGVPQTCTPGTPAAEICDGLDNDCDSLVDEGLGQTTCGVGECQATVDNCIGGVPQTCTPGAPAAEICDGLDNDCDGASDENLGQTTCGVGECQATVDNCIGGVPQTCTAGAPVAEICDGLDNDCDASTDEGIGGQSCNTGQPGVCAAGTDVCVGGSLQCVPDSSPSAEICDGLDNDCDGNADEGNPGGGGSCSTGQPGVCSAGTQQCSGGQIQCLPDNAPSAEICDGLDNDCDGNSDEGNPGGGASCSTGQPGVCSAGTAQCGGGQIQCVPDNAPSAEICDGLDNDCDGSSDEGNPGGGASCSTGQPGVCGAGTQQCSGGQVQCLPDNAPSAEICDGLDNDCDGNADEGNPGGGVVCSTGLTACATGTTVCQAGTLVCDPAGEACDDGDGCTQTDTCDGAGQCVGTDPVLCGGAGECAGPQSCNSATGQCDPGLPEPTGTLCTDDGNICTDDECDGAGSCQHVIDLTNDPSCVATTTITTTSSTSTTGSTTTTGGPSSTTSSTLPAGACTTEPRPVCFESDRVTFQVKDNANDGKDQLKWKWTRGDETVQGDLGDPLAATTYTLCVYDRAAGQPVLVTSLEIPPNSAWQDKAPKGWKYSDKTVAFAGVQKAQLKPGTVGRSKAQIKAKGVNVPMPVPAGGGLLFSLDPSVTVQLVSSENRCWTSDFMAAQRNTAEQFKAKGP